MLTLFTVIDAALPVVAAVETVLEPIRTVKVFIVGTVRIVCAPVTAVNGATVLEKVTISPTLRPCADAVVTVTVPETIAKLVMDVAVDGMG
jgi:hypothetical protein